jgi:2,4-dienoyl-CoA reductase-like NADH-dependent reductase (Old Yellow Enzyme family)
MVDYYRQRAGAGLIITEATSISPMGVGYPDTPGLWSQEQVEGWKAITRAVHDRGGRIVVQLWHVGRISDPVYLNGKLPLAPSAIAAEGHVSLIRPMKPFVTPRALDLDEIPGIIAEYRRASLNAMEAGFDGVEIHGANGYLPDQFLHTDSNKRGDLYGGSVENRARFLLEALDAAISVYGADRVGLHISPRGGVHSIGNSDSAEVFAHIAREAGKRRLGFIFARETLEAPRLTPQIRKTYGGSIIANDSLSLGQGETLVSTREADAVAYGRLFIANPDLPERFAQNAPLNEPNTATFMGTGPVGYTDYPSLPHR